MSLASIPSPHTGTIDLGPLTIHMYGLTLLVAIAACILLTGYRWTKRGGDWDLVLKVAVWGVAAGIVGARAYHDITSWNEVSSPKWKGVFAVWEGGLGVWGGILLGCLVGAYIVHREGDGVAGVVARANELFRAPVLHAIQLGLDDDVEFCRSHAFGIRCEGGSGSPPAGGSQRVRRASWSACTFVNGPSSRSV